MSARTMQANQPARPQAVPLSAVSMAFLFSSLIAVAVVAVQAMDTGQRLAALITEYTDLARSRNLTESAWAAILIACGNDAKCSPWLGTQFRAGMAWYWLVLLLPVVVTPIIAKLFPTRKPVPAKDPGLARWEDKTKMQRFLYGNDSPRDPFIGFMGYLKSGEVGGTFDAKELPPLYIPLEDWCQNTLVWGGIRSGKTTSFFQPNIFLAAHLGVTCVVFDIKWPQKDSGFFETIGYWHARGRRVVLLSPFEEYGARVNLLAGVNSFSDALEVADAVFPPPEFAEERGKHYNDKKRFMIAALIWLLRTEKGDEATMHHVLECAMLPENRLMEWVELAQDEQAKTIVSGYRDAGESNFAETKNGIISALKVFFNRDVVNATSGMPDDTISLEDCFRTPTLVLVGVNQKNMMDGSGEILFRLYKRLLDAAAMRVVMEQGGRLRTHLAYFLDELPSIGRINYLMRSLGTLRSYNISHHLGIQNDAQGQLVYGESYWKAITTNVVARVVIFPRGINGDDAMKIKEIIGKTTATETSVSGSRSINLLEHEGSNGATSKLVERDLLSYEEFSQFSLGEAVIRINGQQPVRTQLSPMGMLYVEGTGIKPNTKHNFLNALFMDTITRCPSGLIAYTTQVIQDGQLIGSPPALRAAAAAARTPAAPAPSPAPALPAPAAALLTPAPAPRSAPAPAPAPPPPAPGALAAGGVNLTLDEAWAWLRACMAAHVEISLTEPDRNVQISINTGDEHAVNSEAAVSRLSIGGLVERTRTRSHVLLHKRTLSALPDDLRSALSDYQEVHTLYAWMRLNAPFITGTPEHVTYRQACADAHPPVPPRDPVAVLKDDHLIVSLTTTREIFRGQTTLKFTQHRVDSKLHNLIPLHSLTQTAAAVRAARDAGDAPPAATPKPSRRQTMSGGLNKVVQGVTPRDDTVES
jgi:type IV secretion system protein VirD4